jgi:hypothetical protein
MLAYLLACLGPQLRVSEFGCTVQPTETFIYLPTIYVAVSSSLRLSGHLDLSAASVRLCCLIPNASTTHEGPQSYGAYMALSIYDYDIRHG